MKNARSVTRYKTHSLLLPSLPSPSSPLTELPPVSCVRAYWPGEGSCGHAGGDLSARMLPQEADASAGAVSAVERPGGTQAPGTETNGMQGPLISFCALCGRRFEPQNTRRGQPKRFCSDACRARAWRRRDAAQNTQNSQKSGATSHGREFCVFCAALRATGPEVSAPFDSRCGDLRNGCGMNAEDPPARREVVGSERGSAS